MKRLLFGITSLTIGGAERVLVDLVNKLSDKYDITIFTIYSKGELEKQLSKKVKLKTLYNIQYSELTNMEKKIIPLKILLNKKVIYNKYIKENYDVEIAFLEGPITRIFSVKNKKARKIAWIHNDISCVFGNGIKSRIKQWLDKRIYCKYETLVFVSKDNMRRFREVYKDNIRNKYLEPIKKEIVYNYIEQERVIKKANEKCDINFNQQQLNFVTVARLVPQKAIDRLINVHCKLIKNNFYHNFYVIGDGPAKKELVNMIKENNIEDTFHLIGKRENPYPYIKNSTCFCLLSNFEGYGMVLEEAKILGKQIIITDTAAREAVEKYSNKIIVENTEEGIYNGLKNFIVNKEKIVKQDKTSIYDNNKIIDKVIKLVGE